MPALKRIEERPTWVRVVELIAFLLAFFVAVKLMGSSIKMLGKEQADALWAGIRNPFAGLCVGILSTVLVQSSSVTTAAIVGLVGEGQISVTLAVPMVMGANIGTSITNTLVALGHITRGQEFRRAFAGATMHDFFNLIAVVVFLPLELMTGFLSNAAEWLTKPFTALAGGEKFSSPLAEAFKSITQGIQGFVTDTLGFTGWGAAVILIVVALVVLFFALMRIARIMRGLMAARFERALNNVLQKSGLIAIVIGMVITASVQSSSITTSLLVPMFGAGILSLEAGFPVTLGANLGTTVTALIASLATSHVAGLTIALVHMLFNLAGILLIYPFPRIRAIPLRLARGLANMAVERRSWVIVYILGVFVVLPLVGMLILK